MKLIALILLMFTPLIAAAQAPSWLESSLYGGGKINTVIAVVAVIIIGLSLWMFMMDRRLKKMEERIDSGSSPE